MANLRFLPTATISSSVRINVQDPLITPKPINPVVERQNGGSSKNTFTYPGCRDDPNGPCALQQRSSAVCGSRKGYEALYCSCTNDYYVRSSECWIDCYQARATSIDTASISRKSRMQELECESLSLAVENNSALSSNLDALSEQTRKSLATTGSVIFATGTTRVLGQTATGDVVPLETSVKWVDRPTATGRQGNRAVSIISRPGYDALYLVTVIVALLVLLQRA